MNSKDKLNSNMPALRAEYCAAARAARIAAKAVDAVETAYEHDPAVYGEVQATRAAARQAADIATLLYARATNKVDRLIADTSELEMLRLAAEQARDLACASTRRAWRHIRA